MWRYLERIGKEFTYEKLVDEKHSTSKKYKIDGFEGSFAFINTVTLPFCGDCNRLRSTADGKMKNCLFSKGEIDLLTPYRNNEDILSLIAASVKDRESPNRGTGLCNPHRK